MSFEDAHFGGGVTLQPATYNWPRFLVRYKGGRYVIVQSETPSITVGSAITACDGKALDEWVDEVAEFEGGPKGLETTRATIAKILFVDAQNPSPRKPWLVPRMVLTV